MFSTTPEWTYLQRFTKFKFTCFAAASLSSFAYVKHREQTCTVYADTAYFPHAYKKSGKSDPAATDSGCLSIAFCNAARNSGCTSEEFGTPAKYLTELFTVQNDAKSQSHEQSFGQLTVAL